jgi:hypothetical protein
MTTVGFAPYVEPSNLGDFQCFAINVVGEDIPSSDSKASSAGMLPALRAGTSFCSYPGVTSKPFKKGEAVTMTVPTGRGRLIQLLGFKESTSVYCGANGPISGVKPGPDSQSRIYEIGRAVVDLSKDQAIEIGDAFSNQAPDQKKKRIINCGGVTDNYFTPSQIPGMRFWLDAGYYNHLADGATISESWKDRSSNGVSFTPNGSPKFYKAGGPNSLPTVNFEGSEYFSASMAAFTSSVQGASVYFVAKLSPPNPAIIGTFFSYVTSSSLTNNPCYNGSEFGFYADVNLNGGNNYGVTVCQNGFSDATILNSGPTSTDYAVFRIHNVQWNATSSVPNLSATLFGSSSNSTTNVNSQALTPILNGTFLIGRNSGTGGYYVTGGISEMIYFDRPLNTDERIKMKGYLSHKYGLATDRNYLNQTQQ